MYLLHVIPSYFMKISFRIILPCRSRSSKWCPYFRFSHEILYVFLFSLIHATCHFNLHSLITQITFGEVYKSWLSSLCSLFQSPITFSLILLCVIRNMVKFLRWGIVSISVNPEAGGPLLAVALRGCSFNILAVVVHIWRLFCTSVTQVYAMPCLQ